jgi:hypothetical protein
MAISARDAKKIFSRERPRHQGCQYPDRQNVLLVNRLIGEVAKLAYQEFKDSVDDKIATQLVSNQPRPAKTGTQKRSTSEPRSNRPLKKARTMSIASMPVTSPVARVQPPPPPSFNQAPLRSSVNDNVAARAIKDSTPGSVTARVTTSDKLATRVNNVDKLSARGNRAESGSNGEVKSRTTISVSVAQSSHYSEQEVTDVVDLVSLLVGPTETLEASSMMMSPPPRTTCLVSSRQVVSTPLLVNNIRRESVQRSITASVTEVKLASWYEHQQGRVVLNTGGTRFVTSKATLRGDPDSLLCAMTQPGSPMHYRRIDEYNSPIYFIDRDPAHFRHTLNYIRLGSSWMPQSLPRELRYLHEIRAEAEFYQLKGLLENLDRRITILSEARFDVAI